jgi:hypothetical protein
MRRYWQQMVEPPVAVAVVPLVVELPMRPQLGGFAGV